MGNWDVGVERGSASSVGAGAETSLSPLLGWEMGERAGFAGEMFWGRAWGSEPWNLLVPSHGDTSRGVPAPPHPWELGPLVFGVPGGQAGGSVHSPG